MAAKPSRPGVELGPEPASHAEASSSGHGRHRQWTPAKAHRHLASRVAYCTATIHGLVFGQPPETGDLTPREALMPLLIHRVVLRLGGPLHRDADQLDARASMPRASAAAGVP